MKTLKYARPVASPHSRPYLVKQHAEKVGEEKEPEGEGLVLSM